MAYSEAARIGQLHNGRKWKRTITGLPAARDAFDKAYAEDNCDALNSAMRQIAKVFEPHVSVKYSAREAVEWFQEENAEWWMEYEGHLGGFVQEANYRLNELYDWADYHRVWLDPNREGT